MSDQETTAMIFGARGVTYTTGEGTFFCPGCEDQKHYRRRTVRRFATLYYVPILPLDLLGEYIECPLCGGSFAESVLSEDGCSRPVLSDGLTEMIKRILVHMVIVDGEVDESEIKILSEVFLEATGGPWSEDSVRAACLSHRENGRQLLAELSRHAACLNDRAKELVVVAACRVAVADGVLRRAEQQMLDRLADTLQVPHSFLADVMAAMPEPN